MPDFENAYYRFLAKEARINQCDYSFDSMFEFVKAQTYYHQHRFDFPSL